MTIRSNNLGYYYNKGKDDGLNGTPDYPHDFNPSYPSLVPDVSYKIEEVTAYLEGYASGKREKDNASARQEKIEQEKRKKESEKREKEYESGDRKLLCFYNKGKEDLLHGKDPINPNSPDHASYSASDREENKAYHQGYLRAMYLKYGF